MRQTPHDSYSPRSVGFPRLMKERSAGMARFSKSDVSPIQDGPGTEWRADLDGYTVSMVKVDADTDLTELLKGLPGDECPSPHWGVVTRGRMWFRHDGH